MVTYLLVNTITGDTYVGRTKQSLKKRCKQHSLMTPKFNTPLGRNIRQYGWDCFQVEQLCEGDKEKEFMNFLNPTLNVPYDPPTEKANAAVRRPVRCVETGVVYESATYAERTLNLPRSGINNAIRGRAHSCGGYHWVYD